LAISEVLTNAVLHAFRTQDLPGTVTVTIDVTSDQLVEAVVRDDGMGMSSRGDSPGLGLGLALIASVADTVEQRLAADGVGFELWMASASAAPDARVGQGHAPEGRLRDTPASRATRRPIRPAADSQTAIASGDQR
jgi:signal transduction histidine kinase